MHSSKDWKEFRLGDLTTWESGKTPSKQNPSFWGGTIPWISASSMKQRILSFSENMLTQEGLKNGGKACKKDDILLLVRGSELHKSIPIGIASKSFGFNQDVKAIRTTSEKLDQLFLYYLFKGQKALLLKLVEFTGIGAGKLDIPLLQNLKFFLPSLDEQIKIANFMNRIDQKIELNIKTNETFEGIAKTLFKSWFVDFDPVKAKVEGRSTGLSDEISILFPNSFENSEIGYIPKGWKVVKLFDLVKKIQRGISPKYTGKTEYPVINQKCIRDSQINFSLCKFTEYKKNMESKFLSKFDVLVNSMGVGTLGRVSLFINHNKKILVDGCVTFIRGEKEVYSLFIFQNLLRREKEIINLSTGSTGQTSLSKDSLLNLDFIKPGDKIIERFSYLIRDLYIQRNNNIMQNKYLTSLKDTLLPRLISGELIISDAEKMCEETGI